MQPERIFVIGHMGAGKALFSEALAKKLCWSFIDANPSLERYFGRHLHDIVGQQGVHAFHECIGDVIEHHLCKKHFVMVLEESVLDSEENRKRLSSEYLVYLSVSIATQKERMKDGRVPLLPIPHLTAFLEQQHAARDILYEDFATLIIESVDVQEDVMVCMRNII